MRTPQEIKTLLEKTKGMEFIDKCAYVNSLNITFNEVRQVDKKSLKKFFPVKLDNLRSVISVLTISDGYLEITTVHDKQVFDYGFLSSETGELEDTFKLIASKPPTRYNPLTYQHDLR